MSLKDVVRITEYSFKEFWKIGEFAQNLVQNWSDWHEKKSFFWFILVWFLAHSAAALIQIVFIYIYVQIILPNVEYGDCLPCLKHLEFNRRQQLNNHDNG